MIHPRAICRCSSVSEWPRYETLSFYSHSLAVRSVQAEFCPPLDGALIAALLADCYHPTESYLIPLRANLSLLRQNATSDDDTLFPNHTSPTVAFMQPSNSKGASSTGTGSISPFDTDSTTSGSVSDTSLNLSSPFGFLRNVFPALPPTLIETTLASAGWVPSRSQSPDSENDILELDMDAVVNALLSEEYIHEIIERGYVPGEVGDPTINHPGRDPPNPSILSTLERGDHGLWEWEKVEQKNKKAASSGNVDTNGLGPRKGKRQKPIPLVDVRQRQHAPPAQTSMGTASFKDPWVYFDSLATQLHSLLPQTPYTQFLAMFHNPSYSTPIAALRAHLTVLAAGSTSPSLSKGRPHSNSVGSRPATSKSKTASKSASAAARISESDVRWLVELVAGEDAMDASADTIVFADARLCLEATSLTGKESAYDLLLLVQELEASGPHVVVHSPAPPTTSAGVVMVASSSLGSASPPRPTPPRSGSMSAPSSPSMFPRAAQPLHLPTPPSVPSASNTGGWQTVTPRKTTPQIENADRPIAAHIPGYQTHNVLRAKKARDYGPPSFSAAAITATCVFPPSFHSFSSVNPVGNEPLSIMILMPPPFADLLA